MKFIDICSGIGGFRLGLEQAGHTCIGYVEIDKYARKSYEAMFDTTDEWTEYDITKLEPDDIPDADLWTFGFPCQDISVAGKKKGLNGEKSGIFYSIIKLIKGKSPENRPEWLLIENVKNLLSVNGGRDFTEVLYEISEAGYDAEWHIINSKDFGVPQNRERVFIIGHLREGCSEQILPITGTSQQISGKTQEKQQKVKEKFGERFKHLIGNRKYQSSHVYATDGVSRACDTNQSIFYAVENEKINKLNLVLDGMQGDRIYNSDGLSKTLTGDTGGAGGRTGLYTIKKESKIKPILNPGKARREVLNTDGITSALFATDYKGARKVAIPYITPSKTNKKQDDKHYKEVDESVFTLTGVDKHGVLIHDDKEYYVRKLTPLECFRLQGFPDELFYKARAVNSDSQLYKQTGNAVTVNVARAIGELLKEQEQNNDRQ